MHSPPVAQGWNALFGALRSSLSIDGRVRELVICRVAVINRAYYEYYQHYPVLLQEGGRAEEAEALGSWPSIDMYSKADQAVLTYVDQLSTKVQVSDEAFEGLRRFYGEEQIVEITALAAGYNLVSRFLEALNLTPEDVSALPTMPVDGVKPTTS